MGVGPGGGGGGRLTADVAECQGGEGSAQMALCAKHQ
jgi:hypothetical protein